MHRTLLRVAGLGTGTPVQLPATMNWHSTMGAAPRVHPNRCPPPCPLCIPDLWGVCQERCQGRGLWLEHRAGRERSLQGEARQRASIVHLGQTNAGDSASSHFPACAGHRPWAPLKLVGGCGMPLTLCMAAAGGMLQHRATGCPVHTEPWWDPYPGGTNLLHAGCSCCQRPAWQHSPEPHVSH